jgi:hypothetical protein
MSSLESFKKELMKKPNVQERIPVFVIVKEFIDETTKSYDRDDIIQTLVDKKMTKVTKKTKPIKEREREKEKVKKAKPIKNLVTKMIIEEDSSEEEKETEERVEKEVKQRKPTKVKKGEVTIGPESIVTIKDVGKRIPKRPPQVDIKVSSYYMNNREKFINFINALFLPYKEELEKNKESISCDSIGQSNADFSLLTHQKIVRDYMNLYTPYRGLLLDHGLGSGKTCTSIAVAEGMKDSRKIIVMTPKSLRTNYMEELKKCGDSMYKKNQFWEWISTEVNPNVTKNISDVLNLPMDYIIENKGAWFVDITKDSNYPVLSTIEKKSLDKQIDEMIKNKYTFINYNGLRMNHLLNLTSGFTKNLFNNSVVIVDEAHNLISRIVNQIKKKNSADTISMKIYEYLLSAKNARVVLLSGTPVINYPNEFGILFNILRGYITTWKIPINVESDEKIDRNALTKILSREKTLDYVDYSPSSKILTITRNPFGFQNKRDSSGKYEGVTKDDSKDDTSAVNTLTDEEFEKNDTDFAKRVVSLLKEKRIQVNVKDIKVKQLKALPDDLDYFKRQYIDENTNQLKNTDLLKRRIVGLSSYFKSAQESLLPKYTETLGQDYHIVRIPMSDFQFDIYEKARKEERKTEMNKRRSNANAIDFDEKPSTYRIFSRLFCNFVIENRPLPERQKKEKEDEDEGEEDSVKDLGDEREGEIEGDDILNTQGGVTYQTRISDAIEDIRRHPEKYLTPEALETHSPKFLYMLENIKDEDHKGLHLVYSQFRSFEGIEIFRLVLEHNGFAQFKVKTNGAGGFELDMDEDDLGKPTYVLYTGTESPEEKELVRNIYNGDWEYVPENITNELRKKAKNNNMGEIIKVFMITSSGSEGINLRNTRHVHIMEPYWHPVRTEQVIGRARRICSHKNLEPKYQTVEVFVYLMEFSAKQLESDDAMELKRKDLSKTSGQPATSDQYLYEISNIKKGLIQQLTQSIKESAFDCFIYSNGKCMNFGNPNNDSYAFTPDYAEQQSDTTSNINKQVVEMKGKVIEINGVKYTYRRLNKQVLELYDYKSYKEAEKNPDVMPVFVGTYEVNENKQAVLKLIGVN